MPPPQQSTDMSSAGFTNPKNPSVIAEGTISVSITTTATVTETSVSLPIDANLALLKPEAIVYPWNLGGGVTRYYPLNFVEHNDAAAIRRSAYMFIDIDPKPRAYTLVFELYDASISQDLTIHYRVTTLGYS